MAFLTIFSTPKAFSDAHIAVIQRNAIRSWVQLGDEVEVLLIGDEEGVAAAAAGAGVRHLPDVARNEKGTPLVNSIFELAQKNSESLLLAYVNADILLLPDFLAVARAVSRQAEKFLLVGQRWDIDVKAALEFDSGWDDRLRETVGHSGKSHVPAGSDYFVFPRGLFQRIPGFAIGRAGWDNWMIYHGVQQPWPVIDATPSMMVVHQNHDYAHLPDGRAHYKLDETFQNAELGGGMGNMYMVLDAEKEFRDGRIRAPRFRWSRVVRRLERFTFPPNGVQEGLRWAITRRLRRLRRSLA
jgi:hypothetical protein